MSDGSRRKPERGPSRRLRFEDEAREPLTSGQLGPKSKKRFRVSGAAPDMPTAPPIIGVPDASPPVEESPATSGQVGPKLKHGGKLRQDSEKARPSERLRREGEAPPDDGGSAPPDDGGPAPPDGEAAADGGAAPRDGPGPDGKKAAREGKRYEKSGRRVENSGAKLDNAREKLAAQKPPKKPGIDKSIGRAAKYQAWRYVHGKIHEVERENVGVKAAHRTELAGEKAVRAGGRFIKRRIHTRPARRVRKWVSSPVIK